MPRSRKLAYLALLATSVIWGFAPPVIKYTLQFISPAAFLFYRFLIVSIILFIPLVLRLTNNKLTINQLLNYLFLGFLAVPLNLLLLFEGIKRTSAIDSSIISITAPILIIFGGVFFLKENVARQEKLGIGLALTGTLVTIVQPLLENGGTKTEQNFVGNLLVFLGVISWAAFTLLSKRKKDLDPFIQTAFSFLLGTILFLPLIFSSGFQPPSLPSLPGILYMAVFGSVIAYFTYIFGLSKIEASEASVFTYLQPLFAVPLAAIWLGEKITVSFLIGAILIILGVIICEKR